MAVRTGDTPTRERQAMLRKPPDILITTPESLFLLLTSQGREMLRSVETVIVDEVHAVAGTKRGAHLALSLERLDRLTVSPLQRIGLSATQRPLEEIGRFVSGARPIELVDAGPREGARPRGRRPARGHGRPLRLPADPPARGRGRQLHHGRRRTDDELDLALDLPGAAEARRAAPLDDRVRQQPPPGRATRATPERAGRAGDRPRAPRLARARTARRDRGAAEARRDPVPRRHLVARARNRHGRSRPRRPGRVAQVGRPRPAADRPCRSRAGGGLQGPDLPQVPARPARIGRGRKANAGRRDRGDRHPEESARRARAADRRDLRRRRGRGRRPARARPGRLSVCRPLTRPARERARHAGRALSVGRVRGAPAAHRVGPDRRRRPRPSRRAPARGDERGHDP